MKNCFPYCFLEIIVGRQNQQGGNKPGKHGNSGNLKNCQNLREN